MNDACAVCGNPVPGNCRRTCGSPRCVRTYRNTAPKAIRRVPTWTPPPVRNAIIPDTQGRNRVTQFWNDSAQLFGTEPTSHRVAWVAERANVRPAEVLSVVRAVA